MNCQRLVMSFGVVLLVGLPTASAQQKDGRVILAESQLADKDPVTRWEGANDLRRLGAAARPATDLLCKHMLEDDNPEVRTACAAALVEIVPETKEAVAALTKAVTQEGDNRVRVHAVTALGNMKAKAESAVPTLVAILKDGETDRLLRAAAMLALSNIGQPSVQPLVECLKDQPPAVQTAAARCLGDIGEAAKPAGDKLVDLLTDEQAPNEVRTSAFVALVKIRPGPMVGKRAIPTLIKVLREGKPGVQQQAAWALGQLGKLSEQAIPALQEAAKSSDTTLSELAKKSIEQIESAPEQ